MIEALCGRNTDTSSGNAVCPVEFCHLCRCGETGTTQKLKVVLAHIERYYEFQKKKKIWDAVMELPLYKQMNAGVFLNWKKRHKAFQLAKKPQPLFLAVIATTWIPASKSCRGAHRACKEIWRSVSPENGSPDQGGTAVSEKKKTMRAVIEIIIAVLVIIAVYFIIRGMDRHDVRIQQAATENETQRVWKEFQEKPSRSSYIKDLEICPSGSDVSLYRNRQKRKRRCRRRRISWLDGRCTDACCRG